MAAWTVAYLLCVALLGTIKLKPLRRFQVMAVGFSTATVFLILAYLSTDFPLLCIFVFLGAFLNCAGNTIFGASLTLALPTENRGAILGFMQSASVGGTALSAVMYGVLGDIFPLYLVFVVGGLLSLVPMLYLCLHPRTKAFITTH